MEHRSPLKNMLPACSSSRTKGVKRLGELREVLFRQELGEARILLGMDPKLNHRLS